MLSKPEKPIHSLEYKIIAKRPTIDEKILEVGLNLLCEFPQAVLEFNWILLADID